MPGSLASRIRDLHVVKSTSKTERESIRPAYVYVCTRCTASRRRPMTFQMHALARRSRGREKTFRALPIKIGDLVQNCCHVKDALYIQCLPTRCVLPSIKSITVEKRMVHIRKLLILCKYLKKGK